MVVAPLPDLIGAILAHLRDSATLMTMTGGRISGVLHEEWDTEASPMPKYAIVVTGPRGYIENDREIGSGLLNARVDISCYGSNSMNATLLWRTLHTYLIPPPASGQASGFSKANTLVYNVMLERGGHAMIDRNENANRRRVDWPLTSATYLYKHHMVPLP